MLNYQTGELTTKFIFMMSLETTQLKIKIEAVEAKLSNEFPTLDPSLINTVTTLVLNQPDNTDPIKLHYDARHYIAEYQEIQTSEPKKPSSDKPTVNIGGWDIGF